MPDPSPPPGPKPPPRPPIQAVHPGRKRPAPHIRPSHEETMNRRSEPLHLAEHTLHPHHEPKDSQ